MGEDNHESAKDRSLHWLIAGAAAGLLVAGYGLMTTAPSDEGDWIARVGDTTITRPAFQRELERMGATGEALSDERKAALLDSLVVEELLFRRGIDLGLAESDTTVRTAVVQSLIASVTAEADAADPDDATLRNYLDAHADRYTYASAMTVRAWVADEERVARDVYAALPEPPTPDSGATPLPGLPTGPSPIERLRMFLGPAIAAAAADMPAGDAQIFARQGRWYIVEVVAHDESIVADFDSVRSQLLLDYRRQLAADRLTDYVDTLRERVRVEVRAP